METGKYPDIAYDCIFTDLSFDCSLHGRDHVCSVFFGFQTGDHREHTEIDGSDERQHG